MSLFNDNIKPVNRLYQESLKPFFEETDFISRIKSIMDEYDNKRTTSNKDFWKDSIVRRIFQVHERVLLVRNLQQKLNDIYDPFANEMYPSLCTYLLLTCFDQLGQPNEWVSFCRLPK